MSSKDNFGDRMKMYEGIETNQKFLPGLPVYVRLDGRGFSKFTRGMKRPYDARMSGMMKQVTADLVDRFGCVVGYTQSDEISLIFKPTHDMEKFLFGSKKQKIVSTLAAYASARFATLTAQVFPEKIQGNYVPTFDCRAFQLPTESEAVNAILWREQDATKNSIQMAGHHYFSHKQLQGLNTKQIRDKLEVEKDILWEDYPEFFKRGSYFKRVLIEKEIPQEIWDKIPENKRPESRVVNRSEVREMFYPPLGKIANRTRVIMEGHEPVPYVDSNE